MNFLLFIPFRSLLKKLYWNLSSIGLASPAHSVRRWNHSLFFLLLLISFDSLHSIFIICCPAYQNISSLIKSMNFKLKLIEIFFFKHAWFRLTMNHFKISSVNDDLSAITWVYTISWDVRFFSWCVHHSSNNFPWAWVIFVKWCSNWKWNFFFSSHYLQAKDKKD